MTSRLLLLLSIVLLAFPAQVRAQTSADLARLNVSIWPEYDRRAVLVIYQARLPADIPLPAQVSLPIPSRVGEPHAVANATASGQLTKADYELVDRGEWVFVDVQVETPTVWVEYYADLTFDGQMRQFSFRWPATVGVEAFTFEVQRPPGSLNMEVIPAASEEVSGDRGLTYLTGSLGAVPAGDVRSLEVSYTRSTDALTVEMQPPAVEGFDEAEPAVSRESPLGLISAGIVGVLAVLAALYLFWFRSRASRAAPPTRQKAPARKAPAAGRYCHQCGQKSQAGDRFCRNCGTQLRESD